ncbi:threonine ammonia-lyase [Pseudogulbenkiania ferrooxidans]|nr:threonine/serine dehydratase [Pseudogulbenkiania ferrooxidans]
MNSETPDPFDIRVIRQAAERLSGQVVRTPVLNSPMLDGLNDCRIFVKAESLQLTGSFKIRGALNKILSMDPKDLHGGVLTYSAGNHGQAVAAGAKLVGCPVVVVLPNTAPAIKVENCRWWGAEIVLYDPVTQMREEVMDEIARQRGMTFISPFDDFDVMAGQGTVGLELCEQMKELGEEPDAVVINCSGGGLASGVVTAVSAYYPKAEFYIVEINGAEKMANSIMTGAPQRVTPPLTVMDGIAGPVAGNRTLSVLMQHKVKCLSTNDEEALGAVSAAFRMLKLVVEPGGAASLAAVLSKKSHWTGKNIAVICSGGNADPDIFSRAITSTVR